MTAQNGNNFLKWARRRSTEYLKKFVGENLARIARQRLQGRPPGVHPPYFEKEMLAAQHVLRERGEL